MFGNKSAFTLIEVIISVIILSGVMLYVLKVHANTRDEIEYIAKQNSVTLQDSLFISNKVLFYNKEKKNAYDIIENRFRIEKFNSKDILKNIKRDIVIPDAIVINQGDDESPLNVKFQEIIIKDRYTSNYFHFAIDRLK